VATLARRFQAMIKERQNDKLTEWLDDVLDSPLAPRALGLVPLPHNFLSTHTDVHQSADGHLAPTTNQYTSSQCFKGGTLQPRTSLHHIRQHHRRHNHVVPRPPQQKSGLQPLANDPTGVT